MRRIIVFGYARNDDEDLLTSLPPVNGSRASPAFSRTVSIVAASLALWMQPATWSTPSLSNPPPSPDRRRWWPSATRVVRTIRTIRQQRHGWIPFGPALLARRSHRQPPRIAASKLPLSGTA